MIVFLRQGWRILSVVFLLVVSLGSCADTKTNDYEEVVLEDDYTEQVAPVESTGIEDVTKKDEPADLFENESLNEEVFIDSEESLAPPIPKLSSVEPVGDVIEDAEWDEITDGVSYRRTSLEEQKKAREIGSGFNFGKGFETGLSVLVWILVISLIVGFLAWLIVRTKVDTSVDKVRDFSLTDELLAASKEELADALTLNLNRQDYRAAIRYRFGQLLQAMRKAGLLVWVPGRTNAEYQSSLQDSFANPFGVLAKAFSFALYSGKDVTLKHYEAFAKEADNFLALLSQLSPKPYQR